LTQSPEAIRHLRESVPDALAEVVMRCLAKRPADRWQTAEELLVRLEVVPSSDALHAGRPPVPSRRVVIGVAIAAALALVLGWTIVAHRGPKAAAGAAKSVAVLPLASLGGDTANAYFADGM